MHLSRAGNSLRPEFTATTFDLVMANEPFVAPTLAFQPLILTGELRFAWPSLVGQSFEIQASDDLREWHTIFSGTSTSRQTTYPLPDDPSHSRRFFRLLVN